MKFILVKNTLKIETTLNIQAAVKNSIILAAHRSGLTCSEIIIIAMKRLMDEVVHEARTGFRVKYQKRRDPCEWSGLHLYLKPEDYEYFGDVKKFMKMSISFIVTNAIEKYLSDIINKKTTDNYRFSDYIIIYEKVGNVPCWRIYWGLPPDLKHIASHPL